MTTQHTSADEQITAGIARLGQFIRTDNWRSGTGLGLTPTQMHMLRELAARGPLRIGALAKAIGVTQPTATDAFEALRRKGLVDKRADPQDRRAVAAKITAAGRRRLKSAPDRPNELLDAINDLNEPESAVLLHGLTKIIHGLQRRGAIPVQRMCATCRFFRPNVHDDPAAPHHCNFVNAAFGDAQLRLDCGEHEMAPETQAADTWRRFAMGDEAKKADAPTAATGEAS